MGILATVGAATDKVSLGGSAISIAQATKSLVTGKNREKLPPGISGFLFDIPETATVNHAAQITDHWVEDNFAIQDHVAIEPMRITLTGKIAELVYTKTQAAAYAESVLNNLQPLKILEPEKSQQAQQYISTAESAVNAVNNVLSQAGTLTGLFQGETAGLNKQQKAYKQIETFFKSRALVTVETPYDTFKDMIIESFEANQDESTTTVSTFTVTFKQLRTVSVQVNTGQLQGRAKEQKAAVINKGQQQGESILARLSGWGK
jgi:predicted alpha-1,6-mannanase (GH76 family)